MEISRSVKDQIKERMEDEQVTQAELARRLGISRQSINKVLTGDESGVAEPLERILSELGLTLTVTKR